MARKGSSGKSFATSGLSAGGAGRGGKRSGGGSRLRQAMADSGTAGGRGVNRTSSMIGGAKMNARTTTGPANDRRLASGTPKPGKLPKAPGVPKKMLP